MRYVTHHILSNRPPRGFRLSYTTSNPASQILRGRVQQVVPQIKTHGSLLQIDFIEYGWACVCMRCIIAGDVVSALVGAVGVMASDDLGWSLREGMKVESLKLPDRDVLNLELAGFNFDPAALVAAPLLAEL